MNLPWIIPGLDRTREVKMLSSNIILNVLTCNLEWLILCLSSGRRNYLSQMFKVQETRKYTPRAYTHSPPQERRLRVERRWQQWSLWKKINKGKEIRENTDLANVWSSERHEGRKKKRDLQTGFYIVAEKMWRRALKYLIQNYNNLFENPFGFREFFPLLSEILHVYSKICSLL